MSFPDLNSIPSFWEKVLKSIPGGIFLCDSQHNLQWGNDHFWSMMRFENKAEITLERDLRLSFSKKQGDRISHFLEKDWKNIKGILTEELLLNRFPETIVQISIVQLRDHGGINWFCGLLSDTTGMTKNEKLEIYEEQEREKKRISQEIHDGLQQILSGAYLYINSGANKLETGKSPKEELKKGLDLIREGIEETRQIGKSMTPSIIKEQGIKKAIERMTNFLDGQIELSFNLDIENLHSLNEKFQVSLYRILQELVNNTIKHAMASHINIVLNWKGIFLTMEYMDNGRGMDKSNDRFSGIGLKSIKSRVDAYNGKMTITSHPGEGTKFRFIFPQETALEKG